MCLGVCRFVLLSETVHISLGISVHVALFWKKRGVYRDVYRDVDGFRQKDKATYAEAHTKKIS